MEKRTAREVSNPKPPEKASFAEGSLAWHIHQFDTNSASFGLDKNWYKFHGIGFLMNTQMQLLPEGAEKHPEELAVWAQQTKRDILGFCLEYLSKGLVFSYKYQVDAGPEGKPQLVDPLYGNKSAVEMIDPAERGGVVLENMKKIQDFFLNPDTPDGAMAVVPSPKGPSGLKTDDGKDIEYLTSFFFLMQKKGNEVVGSTIKTDFTNKEYRDMIGRLTGKQLPFDASLQDMVRAIALINPNERRDSVQTREDVVGMMRQVKLAQRGIDSAFEGRGWEEVYDGVAKGEALYNFNKQTQQYVSDFMEYIDESGHSRVELQKAVAATLLRISQVFLEEQSAVGINKHLIATKSGEQSSSSVVSQPIAVAPRPVMTFGDVYKEVSQIRGCAGGGTNENTTSVSSMGGYRGARINRGPASGEDESSWFECPKCEQRAKPPVGNECPHCHYSKEDFAKEHPELVCA